MKKKGASSRKRKTLKSSLPMKTQKAKTYRFNGGMVLIEDTVLLTGSGPSVNNESLFIDGKNVFYPSTIHLSVEGAEGDGAVIPISPKKVELILKLLGIVKHGKV